MNIVEKNDRKEIILKLNDKLSESKFPHYWYGFKSFPMALYNFDEVYLVNYKELPEGYYVDGKVAIGKCTEKFAGNTIINLGGQCIVICNIDSLDEIIDLDKLYSKMVHEMFHGYQLENGDKRFPNEELYFTYKFTGEFLALRIKEREYLLKAVFEEDENIRKELISDFINTREYRCKLVGAGINYEYSIESIEGTATYVEYKALQKETSLPKKYIIAKYGEKLIQSNELKDFRFSCYFSGMFIALIMDSLSECWQEEYSNSEVYLYNYLKEQIEWTPKEIVPQINAYTSYILRNYEDSCKKELISFYINDGYNIILQGKFSITEFDPINTVSLDGKLLHKSSIKLNNKYIIKEKTLTTYENNNVLSASSVEFFIKDEPLITEGGIYIEDIGELKGKVIRTSKGYIVVFKQPFVDIRVKGSDLK
ncbi:hypothetical protein ACJDT4_20405 [Clostridium neuense]|uniref:Uncharacterized protein n=1 Tax=Clostridium neuense TaxID=1728934 RepID=A0ABW8TJX5_9CLOT